MKRTLAALSILALVAAPDLRAAEEGHDHHDHAAGEQHEKNEKPPHGGVLKEVGDDHLELVFTPKIGALTLYVLDGKLQAHPIKAANLTAQAKVAGSSSLVTVTLAGDKTPAESSTYTGSDASLTDAARVDVIIRVELDGKHQRVVFSTAAPAEHHDGDGHDHK